MIIELDRSSMNHINSENITSNMNILILYTYRFNHMINNNISVKTNHLREYEIISKNDLFLELDSLVKKCIYDTGIDLYLLKRNSIKTGDYKNLIDEYNNLFNQGKINYKDYLIDTYKFLKRNLEDTRLCIFNDKEELSINDIYVCEDNVIDVINKLIGKENINIEDYPYLKEFISYINKDNIKLVL